MTDDNSDYTERDYTDRLEEMADPVDIHPDDTYDDEAVPTEMLDHLSWRIVSSIDDFCPIDETAEQRIESLSDEADEWGETNSAWERGYHAGSFAQMETLARFLWGNDLDVMTRAQRHREVEDLPEFEMSPADIQDSVQAVMARSMRDDGRASGDAE